MPGAAAPPHPRRESIGHWFGGGRAKTVSRDFLRAVIWLRSRNHRHVYRFQNARQVTLGCLPWDDFVSLGFVGFGFVLGWLLWRKNESERRFRFLQDRLEKLKNEIGAPITVIHAQTQLLLGGPGRQLSPEVQSAIRIIYEQSQTLQSINRENIP